MIERIRGKKEEIYIKNTFFAMDVKVGEVISLKVTVNEIHKAYRDRPYNSSRAYDFLKRVRYSN